MLSTDVKSNESAHCHTVLCFASVFCVCECMLVSACVNLCICMVWFNDEYMPLLPTRLCSCHFPVVSCNPETSGARPYSGDGNNLSNWLLWFVNSFACSMFQLIKHNIELGCPSKVCVWTGKTWVHCPIHSYLILYSCTRTHQKRLQGLRLVVFLPQNEVYVSVRVGLLLSWWDRH